jgi:type VI secretion system protein ImpE
MQAEQLIKEGRLADALKALQDAVRNDPANASYRNFLYQLLCVLGDWDRALTQINVVGDLDPKNLLIVEYYRNAIRCEVFRRDVFAGKRTPLMLGEPPAWIGDLVQAQACLARGEPAAAAALRDRAFEAAPEISGTIDGRPISWLADTDHRLGPVLEVIIQGKYYWVPFERIASIRLEAPGSLRDTVWAQAEFVWSNEGKAVGLVPVRYPGTPESGSDQARLARVTEYEELGEDYTVGVGQRMWFSDAGEHPILETRVISLNTTPGAEKGGPGA